MKRKCYIAGPMRGIVKFNFPAFEAAAASLRALGWHVFSPAELDIQFGFTDELRAYIRRDIHVIVNELQNGDAIILLPGYAESVGAQAELAVAVWCELDIYTIAEVLEYGSKIATTQEAQPTDELQETFCTVAHGA